MRSTEIAKLRRIISIAETMIANADKPPRGRPPLSKKRKRRTGHELVQFRKMLKAERRKGVAVAGLARKHNVSTAYIYAL